MKTSLVVLLTVVLAGCHRTIEFGTKFPPLGDPNTSPIVIDRPVLIRFTEGSQKFAILTDGGGVPGSLRITNSIVRIFLTAGWAYVAGDHPFLETERVTVGATGTTFAAQIEGGVHRVFLLQNSSRTGITVALKRGILEAPGTPRSRTLTDQSFVEVTQAPDGRCTISAPQPIAGNGGVAPFIQTLNAARIAANLGGWPPTLP